MQSNVGTRVSLDRWSGLCRVLGVEDGNREYRGLVRAWRGFGRFYHTVDHLEACLRELDAAEALATEITDPPPAIADPPTAITDPPPAIAEVEMALWFHDAVYRTWAKDNEARSAAWAERFLSAAGVPVVRIAHIRDHIMATTHQGVPASPDSKLVVDIDLSILGQPAAVYDAFEKNVRREYWWVPRKRYVAARSDVLKSFLARRVIYEWPLFRDRYEGAARLNLERALTVLRG